MSERPAYQQRVIDERGELADRRHRLAAFIVDKAGAYGTLPPDEQELLQRQLAVMDQFVEILDARIGRFIPGWPG